MTFELRYVGNPEVYFPLDTSEVQTMMKWMIGQNRRRYLGVKLLCWVGRVIEMHPKEYYSDVMGMKMTHQIKQAIEREMVHS